MPYKILFWPDIYLEQGHWLPAISMAQELNRQGHEAVFMGIADCESLVTSHTKTGLATDTTPLTFYTIFPDLYPLGYTRANQSQSINERWKSKHLISIMEGELDDLINNTVKPHLLVAGYFASLEALMLHYKYKMLGFLDAAATKLPIALTTTYLRHPEDDPGIRVIQNLSSLSETVATRVMEFVSNVEKTDYATFSEPLMKAKELIPCPRDFDFAKYKHNLGAFADPSMTWDHGNPKEFQAIGTVFYVEPCILRKSIATTSDEFDPYDTTVIPAGKKVIFATAGSQVQDYENRARNMFQKLIQMMDSSGMGDYHLLLAVGSKMTQEAWSKDLDRDDVTIVNWVDQRKAIQRCSVCFIHGGLATVKEAIYYGKPIVIVPLGKDQMDNALRLREKKLAEIAYAETLDVDGLRNVFVKAQSDALMKVARQKMMTLFKNMEGVSSGGESSTSAVNTGNAQNYSNGTRASTQVIERVIYDALHPIS